MAGGQERVLRRRIRSVQATKKITKAMELIAASQIVRAQNRIHANRRFRAGIARIVVETAKGDPAAARKLLGTPESPKAVGILAIVGDRGLSGAYNTSVFRATERLAAELKASGAEVRLWTVGKKAPAYFRFRGIPVEKSYAGFADKPSFAHAREVAAAITAPFLAGEIDQLMVVSTRFLSAGSQAVRTNQLLPLPDIDSAASVDGAASAAGAASAEAAPAGMKGYTEFEPDPDKLLAVLAPRAVESEVFSALLEGAASFFTAQQRAMAAATDNADELIRTLSRIMNRARQDSITTEIMEIVSGAEALRGPKGA
jgi:F-type H+-transporting ATPase subunit gamma